MTDTPRQQYPETRPLTFQYELAVIGEECGEAVQIIGKALRFGWDSHSPNDPDRQTNLELLHNELGDVLGAVDFAVERGLLERERLVTQQFATRKKLHRMAPGPVLPLEGEGFLGTRTVAVKPSKLMAALTIVLGLLLLATTFYLGRAFEKTVVNSPVSAEEETVEAAPRSNVSVEVPPVTKKPVKDAPTNLNERIQ